MMTPQTLEAIGSLQQASLNPGLWPEAMRNVADACGATGATLFRLPASAQRALTTPNLAEVTAAYAETWWAFDSRAPHIALAGSKPITDADVASSDERGRDPFYQEFLTKFGLGEFAALVVTPLSHMRLAMTIERGSNPFTSDELDCFTLLSRHAGHAVSAAAQIQSTERFAAELALALDHSGCGVIVLESDGLVRFVNERAERLLGDGLLIRSQRLVAEATSEQAALDRLVGRATTSAGLPPAEPLFLARSSGRAPLALQAIRVNRSAPLPLDQIGIATGGAVVLVHDLASDHDRGVSRDLERMGLTRSQARVAERIGRGQSVKEAAGALGIAQETVRGQLKATYSRLGLSRQSELAILVTRLASLSQA